VRVHGRRGSTRTERRESPLVMLLQPTVTGAPQGARRSVPSHLRLTAARWRR
jgi:hypothetical protein